MGSKTMRGTISATIACLVALAFLLLAPGLAWAQGESAAPGETALPLTTNDGDIASGTSGSCYWSIDAAGHLEVAPTEGVIGELDWDVPWAGYSEEIRSVSFRNTVKVINCQEMFKDCANLASIDFSGLDTSKAMSMNDMFSGCSSLSSIDLSGLDTSNVAFMSSMFDGCSSLISIDLSVLDTSSAVYMIAMLQDCSALTSVKLSGLDTSHVESMGSMFCFCESLTSIDLSGLDTSSLTDISNMFQNCYKLSTINFSGFDTSTVDEMEGTFYGCSSLTSLDLSGFDTSHVTNMREMFGQCVALASLDVSRFDTSHVTNMYGLFSFCSSLTSLDLSGFDMTAVEDMRAMFYKCTSLTSVNLSGFNAPNATDMSEMFCDCSSLTSLDLSGCDASRVKTMGWMFGNCQSLSSLNLSGFVTSDLENASYMFGACWSLTSLDLSGFDTSKATDLSKMFWNCVSLSYLDLSSFDTSRVTDMTHMFLLCSSLQTIAVGTSWSTASLASSEGMFDGSAMLVGGNWTAYSNEHIDGEYARIDREGAPGYFVDVARICDETVFQSAFSEETIGFVREQMTKRERTFTVRFQCDNAGFDEGLPERLFNDALEHTGSGTEGDYLRYQIGRWESESRVVSRGADLTVGDITYTVYYYTTAEQEQKVDQKVKEIREELNLEKLDAYERISAIYAYITSHVDYDFANLGNDEYTLKYTAYAALFDGKAVCQGYATLLYRLANECGVSSRVVPGLSDTEPHAWNIVKIGDLYYNVDCTWDSKRTSKAYAYFLKCDANFSDHARDEDYSTEEFYSRYPMSDADYYIDGQSDDPSSDPDNPSRDPSSDPDNQSSDPDNPSDDPSSDPDNPSDDPSETSAKSISSATITGVASKTYTGKKLTQKPTIELDGKVLEAGADYSLSYTNNVNAGTAQVIITGEGNYIGTKSISFTIKKARQTMTAKAKSKTLKAKSLKAKALSAKKLVTVKKAKGKVGYKNASKAKALKKFKVNAKNGTITVPKGTKKGTYKVKVKVSAKGNANYRSGSKTVTVKITVK